MRSLVLTQASPRYSLSLESLRLPIPQTGEVLIRVRACGVCHTDLHVMKAEIPFPVPAVMGHEITGTIVKFGGGEGEERGAAVGIPATLKVGQKVVVPFILPCTSCHMCVKDQEDLCETFFTLNRGKGALYTDGKTRLYRTDGSPIAQYSQGGLSEYVVVPQSAVFPLPSSPHLPFADSCIIGCAVFTAFGAVKHAAALRVGDRIAVIGVGGVGANTIQLAQAFGAAQIIAVDVSAEKLEQAKRMGATHVINATEVGASNVSAAIRNLTTGNRGVDIAFEALGRASTFEQAVLSVMDGGKAVMIGIAPSTVLASVPITHVVRRKIQILGSYGAKARQDVPQILGLAERGKLKIEGVVTQRFGLEEAQKAFEMLDRGEIVGRAIIDMEIK